MGQRGAPNSDARAPPAKRPEFGIEFIPGNASPATRAASAVDLESDDIPESFKCPICKKLPLGNVYQCGNGHTICNKCYVKQKNKRICVTCKALLTKRGGERIRNRSVEGFLDALLISCPYKSKGCQQVLSRGQVESHQKHCVYRGDRVQVCKYFGDTGRSCEYWSWDTKPEEALRHLKTHFGFPNVNSYFFLDLRRGPSNDVTARNGYLGAVVTKQNGDLFLTTMWWTDDENLSFACLQMNKSENVHTVELTFESHVDHYSVRNFPTPAYVRSTGLIHKWKMTLPTTPLSDAPTVLEHKPVSVPRQFLENYLLRDEDGQKVRFRRYDKGMVKIGVKID